MYNNIKKQQISFINEFKKYINSKMKYGVQGQHFL